MSAERNKKRQRRVSLSEEMSEFTRFVSLSIEESRARNELKQRVLDVARQVWPEATVEQFGSHASGLEWCESDMDLRLAVSSECCVTLRDALATCAWALEVEARPWAKVPIVCFRDALTDVDVDVSFQDDLDYDTAGATYFASTHHAFRDVVLLLKAFLKHKALDKPFTGGLGSFRLAVLADHFLRRDAPDDAGEALKAFLRFCCIGYDYAEPLVVYSADNAQRLTVGYSNVNATVLRHTCVTALEALSKAAQHNNATAQLPAMFTKDAWRRLHDQRARKLEFAQLACKAAGDIALHK